jgi:tyrosyl-tRNA synthetase
MSSFLSQLKSRGCLQDASNFDELDNLLMQDKISFYCGFDPTADSLHVGSMVPLILMKRFQEAGHSPIALLGSATGMIGDPSGRSEERKLLDDDLLEHNLAGIEPQISLFLSKQGKSGYRLVKNSDWLKSVSLLDFLRNTGKHFSVNMMLAKDSVKSRLENREQGISYTEFSYMLLQAYDFYHLNKTQGCRLQVGGSDQWGNITAGIELIRRKGAKNTAYGLTFPLLTTSTGSKFGKTAEGTVWLDAKKTSPYKFYQYWLNTSDEDVFRFIRLFTSLEDPQITELEKQRKEKADQRLAQKVLANTLTELVHGEAESKKAIFASEVLFGGSFENVSATTLIEIFSDVPSTEVTASELSAGLNIVDLLVKCGISNSKGAAKRSLEGGGIYLNNERVSDSASTVNINNFVNQQALVIRSGKKNYHLVRIL